MDKDLELWRFIASRLDLGVPVTMLVVAQSSGSSPGRVGYKMAVTREGEMIGTIGGGVMEVNLVEAAKAKLALVDQAREPAVLIEQVHCKRDANASGMICSGKQTIIQRQFAVDDLGTVHTIIEDIDAKRPRKVEISDREFQIIQNSRNSSAYFFSRTSETEFVYQELLAIQDRLYIIGGGHCALALSELASKLGFRITILDDRPTLNTLSKNNFAEQIIVLDSYENVAEQVPDGNDAYVAVMTLGYTSDAVVIRKLIDHRLKYFGVLGSKAKMATLMKELRDEGHDEAKLSQIRTPIGIEINSRTPEEIAVSIAAEMIAIRNG